MEEYCAGGPLDMLSMIILVDTLTEPVTGAEVELRGLTPSHGLARRAIGVQDLCGSIGPINLQSTCALSIRPTGSL